MAGDIGATIVSALGGVAVAAVGGAWGFASSRRSNREGVAEKRRAAPRTVEDEALTALLTDLRQRADAQEQEIRRLNALLTKERRR